MTRRCVAKCRASKDAKFIATLHVGDRLVYMVSGKQDILAPEHRTMIKELFAAWKLEKEKNRPNSSLADRMQSGGS